MTEISLKLKKFASNRDGLIEYMKTLDIDEITSFLSENIHFPNGISLLNTLLLGFGEGLSSQKKKCDVILFILKLIDERDMSDRQSQIITDQMNSHYLEMKVDLLIKIIDYCIQGIQCGNISTISWKDTFPNILNAVMEHNDITYNDQEMSGNEFKKQIINTLCMINWAPNILTKLASMFRSVSLSQEEHMQIISKLCQNMEHLMTQEIPPFTFQLLKLCEAHNVKYVFLQLQNYFSKRIPNLDRCQTIKINKSNAKDSDLDEIVCSSEKDALDSISNVLYHIDTFANNVFPGIKEYLNFLKVIKTTPEFVLHPFQITILLIISSNSQYSDTAFEIVRQSVSRVFHEEEKRNSSAFFEQITPAPVKVESIFTFLVEHDLSERNLIIEGLLNFAFVLLDFKVGLGMKQLAEKHWELGNIILLKLIKTKRDTASHIIEELCSFIIKKKNVTQYIDCLYNMSRNLKLIMIENQIIIINLIENLLHVSGNIADAIIDATMPLIRISTAIRDNLILILRKALWCRTIEIRQMSVVGFLKLLKSIKVANLAAFSNSQSNSLSQRSIISQLTAECRRESVQKVNNEALCLEVLDILRHCLMQQAEVRMQFYEGLYEAVCKNTELGIPVLDLLWNHFNNYYVLEEETLPPINFSKIVTTKNVEVVLQEPIGYLIYTLGLTVIKIKEINNELDNDRLEQCEIILDSLIERMGRCELMHFELDDGTDLTDVLPESQTRLHTLKQAMTVYEALMGYLLGAWNSKKKNTAKRIITLFQAYSRLVDFLKNIHKPKKGEGKKKNKEETEANKTMKNKITIKNAPAHLLNFSIIIKTLQLLFENNIPWTSATESNVLKQKKEFNRYILIVAVQLIQNLKTEKINELKYTDIYFNYCVEISSILYQQVIERLEFVIDFDFQACSLAVELFHNILMFVTTFYKDKFHEFLKQVMVNNDDTEFGALLTSFIEVYQKLVQMEETEAISVDADGKKIPVILINTFSLLVMSLPKNQSEGMKVLEWLETYLNDNVISNKQVANLLMPFWFNLHLKYKSSNFPFENIAVRLCDVFGTVNGELKPECAVALKSIDEGSVINTLLTLTTTLKSLLDDIDWLINRFKSEFLIINLPGTDRISEKREYLKEKERDLCEVARKIIAVCYILGNLSVPNGLCTEVIMKILVHLYVTLSSLTKYFIMISSKVNPAFQSARFELVVKLSGRQFNNIISDFILSIEQQQEDTNTKKKTEGSVLKSKVLKDTRLIPKLVCEIEKYGKNIIQLSNKTKIDLNKYIGPGTSRDFRLNPNDLKAALEGNKTGDDETFTTADDNNESAENMEESIEIEHEDEVMEVEDSDEENENPPPRKKSKK